MTDPDAPAGQMLPVTWCYRCAWDHADQLVPGLDETERCARLYGHPTQPATLLEAASRVASRLHRDLLLDEDDYGSVSPELLEAVAARLVENANTVRSMHARAERVR